MRLQIDVLMWRGAIPESRHRMQAAVSDPAGLLQVATEHSDLVTTFRSAAKPFQLLPLVERGHADRWGFSDEQLAIMSASHTGSRSHLDLVSGILERLGLSDRHLACGFTSRWMLDRRPTFGLTPRTARPCTIIAPGSTPG